MHLKRFSVKGYRSFSDTVQLDDIGHIVVIYGINNVGKTNLLRALALFSYVCRQDLFRLINRTKQNAKKFYEEIYSQLNENSWMFCLNGNDHQEIILSATFLYQETELSLELLIKNHGDSISITLNEWSDTQNNFIEASMHACSKYTNIQNIDIEGEEFEKLSKKEQETQKEKIDLAVEEWKSYENQWKDLQARLPVISITDTARVPIPCDIRTQFSNLLKSLEPSKRAQAKRILTQFTEVAKGLPAGELEPIVGSIIDEKEHRCEDDFGWITDNSVIPLDVLGTGAQTLFSMLATLALADTGIVAIEEPESHLNALLQESLSDLFRQEIAQNIGINQLFIATHSTSFARPEFDLRHIEKKANQTIITQIKAPEALKQYATPQPNSLDSLPVSLVGYDGSVRLPDFVLRGLNIKTGQFIYFVKSKDAQFKILNETKMSEALGDDE